ncbi:MAG: right-handed parallel beta-helix repeat-containing protein [Verrucomicrobiota bacterium]
MSLTKTQKCIGVIVAVAVIGFSVAKADIRDTIQNAKSGTTVQCSGSYSVASITVPSGVTVKGPATFNFTSSSSDGFKLPNSNSKLQSVTVKGAKHGIMIDGSGCSVSSCTATGNHDSGIETHNSGAKSYSISGCTSYGNADSSGGNADGFAVKNGTGSGSFSSCTAYNNSDDGFDFYGANGKQTLSGCQAYSNGSYNGKTGNGDGFKMGGSYNIAHSYSSCTAHNNTAGSTKRGFDTNHNTAKITLTSCHSYSNGSADKLGNCVLSNCTMQN